MTELDRMILLMRRGMGISKEIAKLISNLFKKLTRAINLNKPIAENIAEINKIFKDIDLSDDIAEKLLAVSGATVKIYSDLTPIKPTKALINRSLNKVMPDSNQTIKQGIERTENLTKTSVINYTHQAHDNGWTNKELGAALKTTEAQTVRHVQTIANTAVSAAANQTKTELFKANGIDQVIYTATLDGSTSDFCMLMDGKVFDIDDAPSIPAHYNCLTGDALITTSKSISNIYKREYKGRMFEITTKSGRTIKITPNHPILTISGWKAVKLLNVGDKICTIKSKTVSEYNKDTVIAKFSNLYCSLDVLGDSIPIQRPTAAEHFHGDISDGEVQIVNVSRFGNGVIKFMVGKYISNNRFILRSFINNPLSAFGSFKSFCMANISANSRFMTLRHLFSSLFWRSDRPFNSFLLTCCPKINIIADKRINDTPNRASNAIRNTLNSKAVKIGGHDSLSLSLWVNRIVCFIKSNTIFYKPFFNCFTLNADNISDSVKRHEFDGMEIDNIVSIDEFDFIGHVYNLENKNSWYLSNDIITHNCRSTTVPLMEGENANDVMNELLPRPNVTAKDYNKEDGDYSLKGGMSQSKNYETWLKKQPAYYQKDIIGVKASKEFRDGKPLKDVIKTSPITEDYLNKALN